MHIYIFWKSDLARATAQVRAAKFLKAYGYRVSMVVAASTEKLTAALAKNGIGVEVLGGYPGFQSSQTMRLWCLATFWVRVLRWWLCAREADGKIIMGSLETAAALFPFLLWEPFVVFVQELYDREPRWRFFRKAVLRRASLVIVPTYFRAALLRYWCGLPTTPFVLENRPSEADPGAPVSDSARQAVGIIRAARTGGKRVLLYQGNIDLRERDLLPVAEACYILRDKWVFALLGDDYNSVQTLQSACPSLIYLGRLESHEHLSVTAECDVGVVSYRWDSLNTLFCAPNKTWEYSKFAKPMLSNDVPALAAIMERFHCGISVDFHRPHDLERALENLTAGFEAYSEGSSSYYHSCNEKEVALSLATEIGRTLGGVGRSTPPVLTREAVQ